MKTISKTSLLLAAVSGAGKFNRALALGMLAIPLVAVAGAQAQITVIHSFTGGSGGSGGYGPLIQVGSNLYGMGGGGSGSGVVFAINTDGSGYSVLGEFDGLDGQYLRGGLLASGSTLYGMADNGGSSGLGGNGDGTVFSIPITGGTPTDLHDFVGGSSDGSQPQYGSLIQSGTTLYGTTYLGGTGNDGTVFSLPAAGGSTTVLHAFTNTDGAGYSPRGSLLQSATTLYGMTYLGGGVGAGTVFSIPTTGGTPTILTDFVRDGGLGGSPQGSLIESASGTTLYGMTGGGVFSLPVTGGTPTALHIFGSITGDGSDPAGNSLILSGNTLYGMTRYGGANNLGTIFAVNTDGTGYHILDSFNGTDGSQPIAGSLVLAGSALYGQALGGPTGNGVIFSAAVPEPATLGLLALGGLSLLLLPRRHRVA